MRRNRTIGDFTADKAVPAVQWGPVDHRSVDRADPVVSASEGLVVQAAQEARAVPVADASVAAVAADLVDAADRALALAATAALRLAMPAGAAGSSMATSR